MATKQQKQDLLDALLVLKDECDNKNTGQNGTNLKYTSLNLSDFIDKIYKIDASVLSTTVITDLLTLTNSAINALGTPSPADDIPALNKLINELDFQFP